MLILTRRCGQGLVIGEEIHVRVSRVEGGKVQLGVSAPREVRVLRDELVGGAESPRGKADESGEHTCREDGRSSGR